MGTIPRNDVVSFVAGSLYGESPLSIEDAVAGALRLVDEFDEHGWLVMEMVDLVAVPCPDASEVISTTVSATLDYVSTWHAETERDDYRARAEQVRTYIDVGWRESACCPVCSEVVCDDDCPLYLVRDRAGVWVGSSGALAADLADRFDEVESSSAVEEPEVDEPFSPALAESLDRLAEQERSMGIDDVLTMNDHMVSVQGFGEDARLRWLGSNGVSRETALRHAAWIVALADPLDERFPAILEAVRST